MSTYYETGHAKNVANLLKLNQLIVTLGAAYNPANAAIKAPALATLYTNANTKLNDVSAAFTAWKNATNQREIAFEPLPKFSTQILGALQSSGTIQQTIDDFSSQAANLRSSGSKLTKADAGKSALPMDLPETEVHTHSTSQLSFDNQLQHFQKMVLLVQSVPAYNPNETNLKVSSLQTQLTNLIAANNAANTSWAAVKNTRIQRNLFFYGKDTGLLDVVKQAKAYIKSLYGAQSQQYKAANLIKFVRVVPKKKAV
jgi:hypothetical protein